MTVFSFFRDLRPVVLAFMLLTSQSIVTVFADNALTAQIDSSRRYANAQQWDYAAFGWRQILDQDPSELEARLGLSDALEAIGNAQESELILQEGLSSVFPVGTPSRLPLYEKLGERMIAHGQWIRAVEVYERALKEFPYADRVFVQLNAAADGLPSYRRRQIRQTLAQSALKHDQAGWQAVDAQDFATALSHFTMVAAYAPKRLPALNNAGLAALLSGDSARALAFFKQMDGLKVSWPVYANTALINLALKDVRNAELNTRRALGTCSEAFHKAQLYNQLGYILEQSDQGLKSQFAYERALKLLEDPAGDEKATVKRGTLPPEQAELAHKITLNLAFTQQNGDRYAEAIATYLRLLKQTQDPMRQAIVYNRLGFVYELDDQDKKSEKAYQQAILLNPSLKEAYGNLAMLYKRQGKLDQSTEVLKQLIGMEFDALEMGGSAASKTKAQAERTIERQVGGKLLTLVDVFWMRPRPRAVTSH